MPQNAAQMQSDSHASNKHTPHANANTETDTETDTATDRDINMIIHLQYICI